MKFIPLLFVLIFAPGVASLAQECPLQPGSQGTNDAFSHGVALDGIGQYAVVGAPNTDATSAFQSSGSVFVFQRADDCYQLQREIVASDTSFTGQLGNAVAINTSGEYIIAGAFGDDRGELGGGYGAAYIFFRSGNNWTEQAKLTASDGEVLDLFGYDVAISGNAEYAVATSTSDDGPNMLNQAGSAYIFKRTGANWAFQQKITAQDASVGDHFGWSVAINFAGDYIAVGTPDDDTAPYNTNGSVYIFRRENETWSEQIKIEPDDAFTSDQFGESVALNDDGDYLIAGARWDDDGGVETGSAYIYTRNNTTWSLQKKLTADMPVPADRFGSSVAINGAGDRVAVGTPDHDSNGGNAGGTYVFVRDGSNWTEHDFFVGSNINSGEQLGTTVGISGDGKFIISGAPDAGSLSGAAYVHELPMVFTLAGPFVAEISPLTVFPNPVKDQLTWVWPENLHPTENTSISIINSSGQVVFIKWSDNLTSINTQHLIPGIYGLRLRQNEKEAATRFVKVSDKQ